MPIYAPFAVTLVVALVAAAPDPADGIVSAEGTIEPEEVVDVAAAVPGVIESFGKDADGKPIDSTSRVKKGMVLAQLDRATFTQLLEEQRARVAKAEAELKRARHAAESVPPATDSRAKKGYESAVLVAEASLAEQRAALRRAETALANTTIRSPVDGVVIARRFNVGQRVEAWGPNLLAVFLIATDPQRMRVHAKVLRRTWSKSGRASRPGLPPTPTPAGRGGAR
jgi:HlyD family secretion protein